MHEKSTSRKHSIEQLSNGSFTKGSEGTLQMASIARREPFFFIPDDDQIRFGLRIRFVGAFSEPALIR